MKLLFGSIYKTAIKIESVQKPIVSQVTRPKTAVIMKQEGQFLENNAFAGKFYDQLAAYLRSKNYVVSFCKPESNNPPAGDIWINHGGYNPPKGTKQLVLPQYRRPFFTKNIASQIDKLIT